MNKTAKTITISRATLLGLLYKGIEATLFSASIADELAPVAPSAQLLEERATFATYQIYNTILKKGLETTAEK